MKTFKKFLYSFLICSLLLFFSIPSQTISVKASNFIEFIVLSKYEATANIGDEFYIIAVTTNGKLPTWTSNNSKVASVNTFGKVTAKSSGSATITAKIKGAEASCKVTVNKTKVTISNTSAKMERGETLSLSATSSTGSNIQWKSSKKSVATIDENGKITAIKPGETIITATADKVSATCKLTVKSPTVKLSSTKIKLYRGQSATLTATVSSNINPTWKTNKKSVATVDSNGTITAQKHGTATITATIDGVSKTCEIIVEQPVIKLSAAELSIKKGDTAKVTATVSSGNIPIWTTSNPNILSIDSNGTITALQKGTAYVYASEDGVKMRCTVRVTE